jgi:hypothetical protein
MSCGKELDTTWKFGAADYWDVRGAVRWATGVANHSWIVLQQVGMCSGHFQLCLDMNTTSDGDLSSANCTAVVSPSGSFTGGSLTARPVASDECSFGTVSHFPQGGSTVSGSGGYVLKTSNGKCTRIYSSTSGNVEYCMWLIEEPKNTPTWWTAPWIAYMGARNRYVTYQSFVEAASFYARCDSVFFPMYATTEGAGDSLGQYPSFGTADYNNEWFCGTIGLLANDASRKGWLGEIRDMWWVSDDLPRGTYMPGDGSRDFVVLGNILQPWDGSAIIFD